MVPELLFDIAFCPSFKQNYKDDRPCFYISHYQLDFINSCDDIMIPEPWDGDILKAPILVLSSNPAFTTEELFPTNSWPKAMIADFFKNRFLDRGPKYSWTYNHKILLKDGSRGHSVRYWSSIQKRVEEIIGRKAIPGIDYCMTEIVNCKTNKEFGVKDAIDYCADKFLYQKLSISQASLILAIGSHVKTYLHGQSELLSIPIMYLPHPAAFEKKTVQAKYTEEEIQRYRDIVSAHHNTECEELAQIKMPSNEEVINFIQLKVHEYQQSIM